MGAPRSALRQASRAEIRGVRNPTSTETASSLAWGVGCDPFRSCLSNSQNRPAMSSFAHTRRHARRGIHRSAPGICCQCLRRRCWRTPSISRWSSGSGTLSPSTSCLRSRMSLRVAAARSSARSEQTRSRSKPRFRNGLGLRRHARRWGDANHGSDSVPSLTGSCNSGWRKTKAERTQSRGMHWPPNQRGAGVDAEVLDETSSGLSGRGAWTEPRLSRDRAQQRARRSGRCP